MIVCLKCEIHEHGHQVPMIENMKYKYHVDFDKVSGRAKLILRDAVRSRRGRKEFRTVFVEISFYFDH